jgi:hypothetical protein
VLKTANTLKVLLKHSLRPCDSDSFGNAASPEHVILVIEKKDDFS